MRRSAKVLGVLAVVITAITVLVVVLAPWRSPSEDRQIRWANIVWKSFEANGDKFPHAFLMVDAQLEGLTSAALMQLDLGNEPTVLAPYSGLGIKAQVLRRVNGTIANRRFWKERVRFMGSREQGAPSGDPTLVGSLGSSFFKDRILLLDFVKQRIAILGKGSPLPRELEQGVEYLPMTHNRYGNLLVPAKINGRVVPDVVFDTGSSMFPMVTGRTNWTAWTKRREQDSLNSIIRANSWGRTAVLVGAPLLGPLCVGHACIYRPTVFFESAGLPNINFEGASRMGSALVGNVLFDGQFTVVVDIARGRMGLFRGSLESAGSVRVPREPERSSRPSRGGWFRRRSGSC